MDITFFIYLSSGLFLGWSLGANDAANIFGTAVGTKMVKFSTAAIISSVFIVLGAVLAGSGASQTLSKLGSVNTLSGAFMAALAAAISVYWMIKLCLPVSTSQAIVGAIIGWNLYSDKPTDLSVLTKIAATWIICPILSGVIAILIYWLIKCVHKKSSTHLLRQDFYTRIGLIVAGAFGAFALGANNISNVIGVFIDANPLKDKVFADVFSGTQLLFLIGGLSIAFGVATYSKKVIYTVGNNLMQMSPIVALIVVVSQGVVLFLFASQGLKDFLVSHNIPSLPLVPVSSSQAVIGAVIGIGLVRGGKNINWKLVYKIAIGWVATPIIAAVVCFVSLFFLQNVFNQVVFLP